MQKKQIAFGYPESFLIKKDNLLSGRTSAANRIICHVGNQTYASSFMPEGTYLTGWGQGSFHDTQPVYHILLQYAKEHGLTITGNAYEERLIDEVGAFDKEQQIIQVSIQVSSYTLCRYRKRLRQPYQLPKSLKFQKSFASTGTVSLITVCVVLIQRS